MRTNQRVAILLRRDKKILLLHREKHGKKYYILPGGGVESNETPENAVIREAKEELGVGVQIVKKFAQFKNIDNIEYYFECKIISGKLCIVGDQNHFIKDNHEWVQNNKILGKRIFPDKLRLILEKYLNGKKIYNYYLSQINFKDIRNKCPYIPELTDNIDIYENSMWHDHESVFEHTINVVEVISKMIENVKPKIKEYLAVKVDRYPKGKLLLLSALLHDIAKKDTIIPTGNGDTECPNHEAVGAIITADILKRLDLAHIEKKIVGEIVANHGIIHSVLDGIKLDKQKIDNFKTKYKNIYWELVLLGAADVTATAHTTRSAGKDNLLFRIGFYSKELGLSKDRKLED
ncbi:MAG: NUDIX domain-containing protein [Candidatus Nealsonbacteria bacterium]